jgi:hypothetical protein
MSPEEACRAAQRKFGGVEQVKEAYRDRIGLLGVLALALAVMGLYGVSDWLVDFRNSNARAGRRALWHPPD